MIWMMFSDTFPGEGANYANARVLLVEDDFLIGLSLKAMLEQIGCEVIGPIASLTKAMEIVENDQTLDAAVLDINIIGGTSVPLAERLSAERRPFFFVTGYQSPGDLLPDRFQSIRRLNKPVDENSLSRALNEAMS